MWNLVEAGLDDGTLSKESFGSSLTDAITAVSNTEGANKASATKVFNRLK